MIKLNRGECPEALSDEVKIELTKLYKENKEKDVWNSPKIKKPLKKALLEMSHNKCSYCECRLEMESKDATIDHFLPKSTHEDLVVEWENLFPSCLRCNRKKCDNEEKLINPCEDTPSEFIALSEKQPFRLKGIDPEKIGKNTIAALGLNDIERVMTPRMAEWEDLYERMEEIYDDCQEDGYQKKFAARFRKIMEKCTAENSYAAVKATNMLNDNVYKSMKEILEKNNAWTRYFQELEEKLKEISLNIT